MVNLVGSGGSVIGSFSVNQSTGQVVLGAPGASTSASGTNTTLASATTGSASTGTATTASTTSTTAVPVFDTSGIQIGIAAVNPATGSTELVGWNGTILGVVTQQNGMTNLVGSGGAVLGGFAVNQATGQVVLSTSTGTAGTAS
jgi:hypothetical protein